MADRRRRHKNTTLTPAIIALNIVIVIVMGLLVFFVYRYITTENEIQTIHTVTPPIGATDPVETLTEAADVIDTAEETSSSYISITKAVTTTPAVENSEVISAGEYNQSFFANDLFIGDSIMTGFSGFGYLPNDIVFAKIGLNPETALTDTINDKTAAKTASELLPERIYIMLGTNGLGYMSGDYMARQTDKLITELKAASPASVIVLLTIPPVTLAHEQNKPEENIDKINLYNDLLKNLAEEKDCKLVDINKILRNSDGYMQDGFAEQDGLHFLAAAYKAVLSELQTQMS